MTHKKELKAILLINLFLLIGFLLYSPVAQAQNWINLPPYNTLWPLWSPVLSPIDAATGVPTPLVSSLTPDTQLPVMPGLTWDPSLPYPWLLYNTTSGMAYYDPLYGINLWPAPSLRDDLGIGIPLNLPLDYANLPPIEAAWLASNLPVANNAYLFSYKSFPILPIATLKLAPSLFDLLTPGDILGPILGVPSALAPPPPPPPIPIEPFSAYVTTLNPLPALVTTTAPIPALVTLTGSIPAQIIPVTPVPAPPTAAVSGLIP